MLIWLLQLTVSQGGRLRPAPFHLSPHKPPAMWEGPELEAGKHTIAFDFKPDGPGLGKGGVGVLSVDGKEVARNTLDHTTPVTFPEDESFDVGLDTRTGGIAFKLEPEQHAEAKP